MRKKRLETLLLIKQVQEAAHEYMRGRVITSMKQVYEAAILKRFPISFTRFGEYMREMNVRRQIADYEC